MATKPVMVMDPVEITGDWAQPGKTITSSSSLAIGSWLIPYWMIGVGVLAVGALGASYFVGRPKSKYRRMRRRR